jgi:hypothetical protein
MYVSGVVVMRCMVGTHIHYAVSIIMPSSDTTVDELIAQFLLTALRMYQAKQMFEDSEHYLSEVPESWRKYH